MSFGTVILGSRTRPLAVKALIRHYDLDITEYESFDGHPEFERAFPRKMVPVLITANGLELSEALAICQYIFAKVDPQCEWLGTNDEERAQVAMWTSFVNSDVLPTAGYVFKPLKGDNMPYNEESVARHDQRLATQMNAFEVTLAQLPFLVGDRYTWADIYCVLMLWKPFAWLFDRQWQQQHPYTTSWFQTMLRQPVVANVYPRDEPQLCQERIKKVEPGK